MVTFCCALSSSGESLIYPLIYSSSEWVWSEDVLFISNGLSFWRLSKLSFSGGGSKTVGLMLDNKFGLYLCRVLWAFSVDIKIPINNYSSVTGSTFLYNSLLLILIVIQFAFFWISGRTKLRSMSIIQFNEKTYYLIAYRSRRCPCTCKPFLTQFFVVFFILKLEPNG